MMTVLTQSDSWSKGTRLDKSALDRSATDTSHTRWSQTPTAQREPRCRFAGRMSLLDAFSALVCETDALSAREETDISQLFQHKYAARRLLVRGVGRATAQVDFSERLGDFSADEEVRGA